MLCNCLLCCTLVTPSSLVSRIAKTHVSCIDTCSLKDTVGLYSLFILFLQTVTTNSERAGQPRPVAKPWSRQGPSLTRFFLKPVLPPTFHRCWTSWTRTSCGLTLTAASRPASTRRLCPHSPTWSVLPRTCALDWARRPLRRLWESDQILGVLIQFQGG